MISQDAAVQMQKQLEMMAEKQEEKPLPLFRRDLEMYRAPDEPDGSPAYSLLDPINSQYYKINWAEATLLRSLRPGITVSELIKCVEKETTIRVTPEEIGMFFEQAKRSNLLSLPKPSTQVLSEAEKLKVHPLKWLLFHYLYFRIPLFNPDKFLEDTLPYAKKMISPIALSVYAIISLIGIFLLVGRLDEFLHTFPYFFSITGAISYSVAIIFTKIVHELAHGYVAKYHGVRVPRMGIAFIFFWPVMYTDVTDSWKMDNRQKRLAITAAGVVAELMLAGMSTLGWALTSPGILQSVFFVVASITWISTLLVNVNPAMRFDGYYLFSDILGVDNMQMRAFAYTRWRLRKWLLGLDVPPPEDVIGKKRRVGMMVYTIYTWVYRIFLYTAIAILVYTQFTKALGLFLFFVEIGVFLVWPFTDEVKRLLQMRQYFKLNFRLAATLLVVFSLLLWVSVPMPHMEKFSAITIPQEEQVIYIPRDGIVEALYVERGGEVVLGQPIVKIFSKSLESSIAAYEKEKEFLETEIGILSGSTEENRALIPEKMAEMASVEEALLGVLEQKKQNIIYTTVSGRIYHFDDTVVVGQYVSKDQILGKIADMSRIDVYCFVKENLIDGVEEGKPVTFTLKNNSEKRFEGVVEKISPIRVERLNYPQLSSMYHGDLPVSLGAKRELIMVESYYNVRIKLKGQSDSHMRLGQTGVVFLEGKWRSIFWDFIKRVWALFWEESTF